MKSNVAVLLFAIALAGCEEVLPVRQPAESLAEPAASEPQMVMPRRQSQLPRHLAKVPRHLAKVPTALLPYGADSGLAGTLTSAGSDTLANLVTQWAEAFQALHPAISLQVQAAGSSTAPPALTEGTADLGPMSRPMTERELAAFRRVHGYEPLAVRVAIDALAVYVHADNPVPALSLPEVDAIFSETRRCGLSRPIRYWGDLDLPGSWRRRPVQRFGRNSVSGTYGYFKSVALCGGDTGARVNEQPGSASVVQAVASSLNGIGYSSLGFQIAGVRALPLAPVAGVAPVSASHEAAARGDYPLARPLYLYVNKEPDAALAAPVAAFLAFVLSRDGQVLVAKEGYVPLLAAAVRRERQRLSLP